MNFGSNMLMQKFNGLAIDACGAPGDSHSTSESGFQLSVPARPNLEPAPTGPQAGGQLVP